MAEYELHQVVTAPGGWRAVFWTGERHLVQDVYLLAMATISGGGASKIVSLSYDPAIDWVCNESDATFCGLLPPGWDLGRYEALEPQQHVPAPQEEG